jgi:hypothetical protein
MNLVMLLLQHTVFGCTKLYDSTLKFDLADELRIRTCYQTLTGSNPIQIGNFIVAGNCDNVAQTVDYYFLNYYYYYYYYCC